MGHCAPSAGRGERRQGAELSVDGAVTKEPLVSHQRLQAQRKEVRGPLTSGGPTPESPFYSSSQSPERGRPPGVHVMYKMIRAHSRSDMPRGTFVIAEADGSNVNEARAFKIAFNLRNFTHATIQPTFQ